MREARRRTDRGVNGLRILLLELLALDNDLDIFLVLAPQVIIAPPLRSLVFALKAEVLARCAEGCALVALFAS